MIKSILSKIFNVAPESDFGNLIYLVYKSSGMLTVYQLYLVYNNYQEDTGKCSKGKRSHISTSFIWDDSPQGWDYWNEIDHKVEQYRKEHANT